jgi:hypothetical protein
MNAPYPSETIIASQNVQIDEMARAIEQLEAEKKELARACAKYRLLLAETLDTFDIPIGHERLRQTIEEALQ